MALPEAILWFHRMLWKIWDLVRECVPACMRVTCILPKDAPRVRKHLGTLFPLLAGPGSAATSSPSAWTESEPSTPPPALLSLPSQGLSPSNNFI